MQVVAFDAMGTVFDLGELGESAAFRQVLHHATALTLAGAWASFDELARAVDEELPERLSQVQAYPDAREALEAVRDAGCEPWILTNGTRENTERLLDRSRLFAEVHTVEEVRGYKPHPEVYRILPTRATLVAAHAWDVVGARSAGYRAVWVDRVERRWPLPLGEPHLRAHDLLEAARLATTRP